MNKRLHRKTILAALEHLNQPYLLAMKAIACRDALPGFAGDQEDVQFLVKKMNTKSVPEIQEVINKYFEDEVLGADNIRVLTKLIQEIHG